MHPAARLAIGLCIATATSTASPRPASALTLHPVSIKPAISDKIFPGGPGAAAANAYCLACHSVGMVMNQPDMTRDGWRTEVTKMRDAFKAPIPDDQIANLANYLYAIKGAEHGAQPGGDAS